MSENIQEPNRPLPPKREEPTTSGDVDIRRRPRREAIVLGFLVLVLGGVWAAGAMWKSSHPPMVDGRGIEEWKDRLDHADPRERQKSAEALGQMGRPARAATEALAQRLRKEEDPRVLKALARALVAIEPQATQDEYLLRILANAPVE